MLAPYEMQCTERNACTKLWVNCREGAVRGSAQGGVWMRCWPSTMVLCETAAQAAHTSWLEVYLTGAQSVEDLVTQAACGMRTAVISFLHFFLSLGCSSGWVFCSTLCQTACPI